MVENIFKERAHADGRRRALERREIHELVQEQVSELGQDFHSQSEIQVCHLHQGQRPWLTGLLEFTRSFFDDYVSDSAVLERPD